jgi:hypothetical protein
MAGRGCCPLSPLAARRVVSDRASKSRRDPIEPLVLVPAEADVSAGPFGRSLDFVSILIQDAPYSVLLFGKKVDHRVGLP